MSYKFNKFGSINIGNKRAVRTCRVCGGVVKKSTDLDYLCENCETWYCRRGNNKVSNFGNSRIE